MRAKFQGLYLTAACISLTLQGYAFAWGQYGHEQVNEAAVQLLANSHPLKTCLTKNDVLIKRYAISPDMDWKAGAYSRNLSAEDRTKRAQNDKEEHPLHFFEVDAFFSDLNDLSSIAKGEYSDILPNLKHLLSLNAEAVTKIDPAKHLADPQNPTAKEVSSHGTAPWRILQLHRLAVSALKKQDVQLALFYLATMGHYVGDIAMPFHTTLNYDGQSYNPSLRGIHEAVDTLVLPVKGKDNSDVYPNFPSTEVPVLSAAKKILDANPYHTLAEEEIVGSILENVKSSYTKLPFFLETYAKYLKQDLNLRDGDPSVHDEKLNSSNRHPKLRPKTLPADLERAFARDVIQVVDQQLGEAAALLNKLWIGAYDLAGQPNLDSSCQTFEFDQSFAIQNYPRPGKELGEEGYLIE